MVRLVLVIIETSGICLFFDGLAVLRAVCIRVFVSIVSYRFRRFFVVFCVFLKVGF